MPYFAITKNPLKAKISYPINQDITFKFNEIDQVYVIPAHETEIRLNFKDVFFRLSLAYIQNAISYKQKWFIINQEG